MGQEIAYCAICGTQLRGTDFGKGGAFRVDSQAYCKTCAPEAVRALPPEKIQAILKQQGGGPKEKHPKPDLSRTPAAGTPRPQAQPRPEKISKTVLISVACSVGVSALLTIGWLLGRGSEPDRPPPPEPVVVKPAPPVEPPRPKKDPPPPVPAPAPAPAPSDAAAASLKKARDFEAAYPTNLMGQLSVFTQASRDCKGSRLEAEAAAALADCLKKLRQRIIIDLAAVDELVKPHLTGEAFGKALSALDVARGRYPVVEWTEPVDQKKRAITGEMDKIFAKLKTEALEARKAGSEDKVKPITDRVAHWEVAAYSKDLATALGSPPRDPAPPTEAGGILFASDFSNLDATGKGWKLSPSSPQTFNGKAEFLLDASATRGALTTRSAFEAPFRVSVDVEFAPRTAGMLVALRLHAYDKEGKVEKLVHADLDTRYSLYSAGIPQRAIPAPANGPAQERWTIDVGARGTVIWSVDGKEILRQAVGNVEMAFAITLEARALAAASSGGKVRFNNLTVERLKR